MPGYNHRPWCSCGWCGGPRTGQRRRRGTIRRCDESGYSVSSASSKPSATPQTDEARTYLTQCWWCGATVYFHSNGYGDAVLFDSLGIPWQVHSCWEKHREKQKQVKTIFDLSVDKAKCLVLAGAINNLLSEGFTPTKAAVAKAMGTSIRQLHADYGHLYVCLPGYGDRIDIRKGF